MPAITAGCRLGTASQSSLLFDGVQLSEGCCLSADSYTNMPETVEALPAASCSPSAVLTASQEPTGGDLSPRQHSCRGVVCCRNRHRRSVGDCHSVGCLVGGQRVHSKLHISSILQPHMPHVRGQRGLHRSMDYKTDFSWPATHGWTGPLTTASLCTTDQPPAGRPLGFLTSCACTIHMLVVCCSSWYCRLSLGLQAPPVIMQ